MKKNPGSEDRRHIVVMRGPYVADLRGGLTSK